MSSFNRRSIYNLNGQNGRMDLRQQPQVVCTNKLWYQFFLYSPFSNIGGVFRYVRQSGEQARKIAISLQ